MKAAEEALRLLAKRGAAAYCGEPVSQLEHALQCASFAVRAGSPPELVIAALLHDVGHLLPGDDETLHEVVGYEWLLRRFGPGVAEPARCHVAAKRYLCFIEPEYLADLSPASVRSLAFQGGPFREEEARAFEALPHHSEAVLLRRWDDAAKVPGMKVPGLDEYRELLDLLG